MKSREEKVPHLAAIIVGNDGASMTYVNSKVKACKRVGFESSLVRMSGTTSEMELLDKIEDYIHQVGHSERTDAVIEPYISEQWFLEMKNLAIVLPTLNEEENISPI